MTPEAIVVGMFLGILAGVLVGFPIAFTLCGLALLFGLLGWGPQVLELFPHRLYGVMSEYTYVAIPLFIFMGCMLEKSGIAEVAFDSLYKFLGSLKGGLAHATVLISTLFAACTGIVGASVTTMGLIALPAMLKRGYDKSLATGTIAAAGTLGILIPPSIMLILYAPMSGVSVVEMFAGAILPGLILSALYMIYIAIKCLLRPDAAPALPTAEKETLPFKEALLLAGKTVVPFLLLILAVLGAIFFGVCAPTEAAGVGALGSLMLAGAYRRLSLASLQTTMLFTLKITAMIMFVAIGATMFTTVFFGIGGGEVVTRFLLGLSLGKWGILALLLFIVFILGMFIDWVGILLIITPIFAPILKTLGFHPLWSGILICVLLQTSFLTPPFAYSLFYIKGIAPPSVTLGDIYRGVVPFVMLQLVGVVLCVVFPKLIMWLPGVLK